MDEIRILNYSSGGQLLQNCIYLFNLYAAYLTLQSNSEWFTIKDVNNTLNKKTKTKGKDIAVVAFSYSSNSHLQHRASLSGPQVHGKAGFNILLEDQKDGGRPPLRWQDVPKSWEPQ